MKTVLFILAASLLVQAQGQPPVAAPAQTPAPTSPAAVPSRLATINIQAAILATAEGKKAAQDLNDKFQPRKQALEKSQSDLAALQSKMRSGSSTMNQAARDKLTADIDTRTKAWNRDSEDFSNEVQQAEGKLLNEIGQKMLDIIEKYANEHGVFLVVDLSSPQTPVIWANSALDITTEIIKRYDASHAIPIPAPAPSKDVPKKQ